MKKIYFINQSFNPYTDLCIITWIEKSDFEKILEKRNKEWIEEDCEHWIEWFYDRLASDIKKLWWKIECIEDENIVLDY